MELAKGETGDCESGQGAANIRFEVGVCWLEVSGKARSGEVVNV